MDFGKNTEIYEETQRERMAVDFSVKEMLAFGIDLYRKCWCLLVFFRISFNIYIYIYKIKKPVTDYPIFNGFF
jgi:hypothetical protein